VTAWPAVELDPTRDAAKGSDLEVADPFGCPGMPWNIRSLVAVEGATIPAADIATRAIRPAKPRTWPSAVILLPGCPVPGTVRTGDGDGGLLAPPDVKPAPGPMASGALCRTSAYQPHFVRYLALFVKLELAQSTRTVYFPHRHSALLSRQHERSTPASWEGPPWRTARSANRRTVGDGWTGHPQVLVRSSTGSGPWIWTTMTIPTCAMC